MFGARRRCQRLPMRNTATCLAVDCPQRSVTPDVLGSGLWMSLDLHGAEFEVDPRSANATAQGTVAARCDCWSCRQRHSNCATVAGAFVRGHFADVGFGRFWDSDAPAATGWTRGRDEALLAFLGRFRLPFVVFIGCTRAR